MRATAVFGGNGGVTASRRGIIRMNASALQWASSVDGCPGTHRFVTADTPRVYGTTRLLGWTDLNETADVTWTGHKPKRKTVVSSAERGTQGGGRSEQTLAAF